MTGRRGAERLFWSLVESVGGGLEEFVYSGVEVTVLRESIEVVAAVAGLTVEWVSINANRVDLLRGDRREWRVVYFVDSSDRVTSLSLFEKPPAFDGVTRGVAVVLNGPSGAGKSSLMRELVERSNQPWVMFDEPWLGTVKQPYLIWREAAPVLHRGFLNGMAALAATGNQVILSSGGSRSHRCVTRS